MNVAIAAGSEGQGITIPLFPRLRTDAPSTHIYRSNISVANSHEYAYLARVDIGGQQFLVLIDTGSSDLWVVSTECIEEDCHAVTKYQPTSSLTWSNASSFGLDYLLGSVSGKIGTELVTLGPYEISTQAFAMANKTSGLGLSGTGNSGILGLAFPLEAAIPDTSGQTLLENIFASFADSDRYFAFKLGRNQSDSSFSFGQLDPAFANSTSNFTFSSVYPAFGSTYDYWKLPIQSLTINSTSFALSPSRVHGAPSPIAVLDTGTTLILGPRADVDRLWNSVGGARKTDTGGWQVRCNRGIVIGFVLGQGDSQKEYILNPTDLSWRQGSSDGDWCMGGIQANDGVSSGDWLLGDTFLRNVYAIHHMAVDGQSPKIGLLGMTDANSSMALFRAERGDDDAPPVPVLSAVDHHPPVLGTGAILGLTAVAGFVFGALITCLLHCCFGRKARVNKGRR
ncbi:unnamed protein product [Somion occarium]|uniref:Peptidase A1 domain-containing protein n=1 Tax=Somion occarium TaxID=3059160 RepID=A0ABP1D8Z8_9APHY